LIDDIEGNLLANRQRWWQGAICEGLENQAGRPWAWDGHFLRRQQNDDARNAGRQLWFGELVASVAMRKRARDRNLDLDRFGCGLGGDHDHERDLDHDDDYENENEKGEA